MEKIFIKFEKLKGMMVFPLELQEIRTRKNFLFDYLLDGNFEDIEDKIFSILVDNEKVIPVTVYEDEYFNRYNYEIKYANGKRNFG